MAPDNVVPADPEAQAPARVLVADDGSVNRLLARYLLESLGCDVQFASNGTEALEALRTSSFDIVLMDCEMPELDGYETTVEIRRHERAATRIPVIAMTAHTGRSELDRCLQSGMDGHIAKPLQLDDVKAVLARWVQGAAALE